MITATAPRVSAYLAPSPRRPASVRPAPARSVPPWLAGAGRAAQLAKARDTPVAATHEMSRNRPGAPAAPRPAGPGPEPAPARQRGGLAGQHVCAGRREAT